MMQTNWVPIAPCTPARFDVQWTEGRLESLSLPLFMNADHYQMEGKYFIVQYEHNDGKIKIIRLFVKINNKKMIVGFN